MLPKSNSLSLGVDQAPNPLPCQSTRCRSAHVPFRALSFVTSPPFISDARRVCVRIVNMHALRKNTSKIQQLSTNLDTGEVLTVVTLEVLPVLHQGNKRPECLQREVVDNILVGQWGNVGRYLNSFEVPSKEISLAPTFQQYNGDFPTKILSQTMLVVVVVVVVLCVVLCFCVHGKICLSQHEPP